MKSNNAKKHNATNKVKPVTMDISLVITGQDAKGNAYDQQSCCSLIQELQNAGCFNKLAVYVAAPKKVCFSDESAKGTINVARINKLTDDGNLEVVFFGKNVEFVDKLSDMVIVPRVRTERDSTKVTTITSFEFVHTMEA